MNATVGFWVIVVGYLLATVGAALLYFNAPKDVGVGTIPTMPGSEAPTFFKKQKEDIASRAKWSRYGFGLLLLGSLAR